MRKSTKFCIFLVSSLLLSTSLVYSQFGTVVQFTNGNSDYNPRFPVYNGVYRAFEFEYFVFERRLMSGSSEIYIQKIDADGPINSPFILSEGSSVNSNPVIAYTFVDFPHYTPKYILVLWESDRHGNQDIYGRAYFEGTGWSNEFVIDSTSGNAVTPEIVCKDTTNFLITYEKEGNIYYRTYDLVNSILTPEINITSSDTIYCKNPKITVYGDLNFSDSVEIISYEKNLSPTEVPIEFRVNSNDSWSKPYLLTGIGKNRNLGFQTNDPTIDVTISAYARDHKVFATEIGLNPEDRDSVEISNPSAGSSFYYYTGGRHYPIINDMTPSISINCFLDDDILDKKAVFFNYVPNNKVNANLEVTLTTPFSLDTLVPTVTLGYGLYKKIPNGGCGVYWFIFNKSQSGQYESRIFGVKHQNCFVGITPISSEIPNSFALKQNYPNPFNPSTKIRFDIPKQSGNVKLSVYNTVGQEVALLINEQLQPGVYEYDFNAGGYPSGVYYYRLQAGEYSETKRMVLVK